MDNEYPKFQATMDEAYNSFAEGMSYRAFLRGLPARTAEIVVLGNLNYQVENGGFSQWHVNGYHVGIGLIEHALIKLGTQEADEMLTLLARAVKACIVEAGMDDDEWDDRSSGLHELDSAFYALAPRVLAQIENSL